MKAVRLHDPFDLRVEDINPPAMPGSGYVNIRIRAAGICGSDLHNYRTGQWISRRPSTAGHELCGEIVALGDNVAGFEVGDFVVADSRFWCGECAACQSGRKNICECLGFVGEVCDGGFAEQIQLPARLLVKHDRDLPARIATMAEPLAVAMHGVRRLSLPAGEPVLVVGCGAIGGLAALVLGSEHEGPLLLADVNAARLALVESRTHGRRTEVDRAAIERALDGRRLRYAIDATGNIKALNAILDVLSGGGALALVGISHGTLEIDPNLLVEREIALIGCHAFTNELPDAVALLPRLASKLEQMIDVLSTLDEIPAAYETLLGGESQNLKSILELGVG